MPYINYQIYRAIFTAVASDLPEIFKATLAGKFPEARGMYVDVRSANQLSNVSNVPPNAGLLAQDCH